MQPFPHDGQFVAFVATMQAVNEIYVMPIFRGSSEQVSHENGELITWMDCPMGPHIIHYNGRIGPLVMD